MDGKPRTARRFTVYKNCPLPTPEDRLLFILVSLKTYPLQVVQGRLFGMVQGKANQWIHVLLPVLLAALRALGDAPARSLSALAQRLGVSEADAATAAVGRRVSTLCQGVGGLRQQLALYHTYDNFCLPHASLRQALPQPESTHGTGSARQWRPCTPAMATGLTDHVWTLREVLLFRVPPWPQPQAR